MLCVVSMSLFTMAMDFLISHVGQQLTVKKLPNTDLWLTVTDWLPSQLIKAQYKKTGVRVLVKHPDH